ncbi:MAG: glycerol uptake facilitator protein [Thermoleophilaceae bacterium]|jgi:MIP family channel proteins|nr:glycerol uptake facilitator protein [Thermoleophilaceae bacterium]
MADRTGAFRSPAGLGERWSRSALLGEVVGTFLLIFVGCGAVVAFTERAGSGNPDLLAIALAWGFAVLAIVYAFGHVSGAHVNPSVTIGLAVARKFPWNAVPAYIGAQLVGGLLGSLAVWAVFGSDGRDAPILLGTTAPGDGFSVGVVFLAEVLITFILLIVVMATATDERAESPAVGLGVGLTIAAGILVAGPVSGASFNPVRTLAPDIVAGQFPAWAAYLGGPLVGAVLGALLYEFMLRPGEPPEPAGAVEEHERGRLQ